MPASRAKRSFESSLWSRPGCTDSACAYCAIWHLALSDLALDCLAWRNTCCPLLPDCILCQGCDCLPEAHHHRAARATQQSADSPMNSKAFKLAHLPGQGQSPPHQLVQHAFPCPCLRMLPPALRVEPRPLHNITVSQQAGMTRIALRHS